MEEQIKKTLDKIRPHLKLDGGDVEFVTFNAASGELKVRLQGACSGCPMSQITLKEGVGRLVMEEIPAVKKVTAV